MSHSYLSNIMVDRYVETSEAIVEELICRGFQTERLNGAIGLHDAIVKILNRELAVTATYSFVPTPTVPWIDSDRVLNYVKEIVPTPEHLKAENLDGDGWNGDLQNQ